MKKYASLIMAFLLGISVWTFFEFISLLKEKLDLSEVLEKVEQHNVVLTQNNENLSQDLDNEKQVNVQLNSDFKVSQDKLAEASANLLKAQKLVEDLNNQLSVSKAENQVLRSEIENLKMNFLQVNQEKEELLIKFNSIEELKKAIRELKQRVKNGNQVILDGSGNKGYIIKDGKSTYSSSVRIEVQPLPETK